MPYKALYNGDTKGPRSVPEHTAVKCPSCGDAMHVVKSHERETGAFVSRHFRHNHTDTHGNGGGGGGADSCGESDEHIKLKSIAADKLEHIFEDRYLKCELEYTLHDTATDAERRQADALLLFDTADAQLGQGVAIEVQYKNKTKDKDAVARDYVENNISLVWVTPDDFGDHDMRLNEADLRDRARRAVWPDQVADRRTWPSSEYAPTHLSWENNGVDRFHIGRQDVMTNHDDRDVSIPATFTEPIVDTLRYRESDWTALFADHAADHFRAQAAIPTTPTTPLAPKLPVPVVDTLRYRESDWPALFDNTTVNEHLLRSSGKTAVPATIPREHATEHKRDIKVAYQIATGQLDYDLEYQLKETNAPRRCSQCGGDADKYFFIDGMLSTYRCLKHTPDAAEVTHKTND